MNLERNQALKRRGEGSAPWTNRISSGTPEEDHVHFPTYRYNEVESLNAAAEAAAGDLAGIVVSAFRHDAGHDQELPELAFARRAREICDAEGAALILDDVRAGLRLSLDASWSELGVQLGSRHRAGARRNREGVSGARLSESP